MSLLEVHNLKFKYTDKDLFQNVDFKVEPHEHIGLVGKNGIGKSTFMNLIAKNLIPDGGTITWLPHVKYSYLDQHLEVDSDLGMKEYVLSAFQDLLDLENRMNQLFESLADPNIDSDKTLERALSMQEMLESKGLYEIETQMSNVFAGLGLKHIDENTKLGTLSGGQRAKVFLAKMLLEKPDVLLLDEPTNFLDVEHVQWLQEYLKSFKGAFVCISHNYDFLDGIVDLIYELDSGHMERYKGNLSYYLSEKQIRREDYEKKYINQQKFIKKTQEFIDKNIVRATSTKAAQSRRKVLERLEVLDAPIHDKKMKFSFPYSKDPYQVVLKVNDLVIGYDHPLLSPISLEIRRGEKVVITGKNGIGKSTFLKTIVEEISSLDGSFQWCETADIMYLSQDYTFRSEETPFLYIHNKFERLTNEGVRESLAKMQIVGDLPFQKMTELSGGQQVKTRMVELLLVKSNILILDEPTNHLDQNAKNSLLEALKGYPGTILLVSHEKEFYEKLTNKVISFD